MFGIKIKESINELRVCSSEFIKFYKNDPSDKNNTMRVSKEAIEHFDFIINEILRIRDVRKNNGMFQNTDFERSLKEPCGKEYGPANDNERKSINTTPTLPNPNIDIFFGNLITKYKHRENANFRIEADNSHIILFSAHGFQNVPASIVEFDVQDFCQKAENVANYI